MREDKYYSWATGRILARQDGCPYDQWGMNPDHRPFAVHPKGFLVFLSAAEIKTFDEYSEGDPYEVAKGIDTPFQARRVKVTLDLLKQALSDTGSLPRILDVGCGEGHITSRIRQTFHSAEVSGLDCSLSAIVTASEKFEGIDFIVGNAYDPPYCRDYFDAIICNNLWEHVSDPLRLLKSLQKVLKPGGHLVVSTPSRYRLGNLLRVVLGRPVSLVSEHHVTEYTVGQVIEQLSSGGFELRSLYSKPLEIKVTRLSQFFTHKVAQPIIDLWLRITHSHHSLAETVFYLARKRLK